MRSYLRARATRARLRQTVTVERLECRELLTAANALTRGASAVGVVPVSVTGTGDAIPPGGSVTPVSLYATPVPASSLPTATVLPAVTLASAPYTPSQIRHAYGVDQLTSSLNGAGQTIAIVDAFDDPTAATDLAEFSQQFGLAAPSLTKVDLATGTPSYNSGWAMETSLDIEWAHAIAPGATILLVESASDSDSDMMAAVDYAVAHGADQVSMSWGDSEYSSELSDDARFNHPGVTFLAASGDGGEGSSYPAASAYVTAVGGTSLSLSTTGARVSETAWGGSGGGTSSVVSLPTYQSGFLTGKSRGIPDVSFDADPNTGFYVYDSSQGGGWYGVGGTSAAAPQWAGLIALVNQGRAAAGAAPLGSGLTYGTNQALYQLAGGTSYTNAGGNYLDITSGSNGLPATTGYDLVTGLGSPVANTLVPNLIAPSSSTPVTTGVPSVSDAGFESPAVGSGVYQAFAYNPAGAPWAFSAWSGVTGNGSGFSYANPDAPEGTQAAFLQEAGTISQSVAGWAAGSYALTFQAAQRGVYQNGGQDFRVLVDGNPVGTFDPSGTAYAAYTTAAFTVAAGAHTITFQGLDSAGGDNTAFIDEVAITSA